MVKKIVGTGVLLVLALALQAGVKMYTLKSPDGKVKLEVTAGQGIAYSLFYDGRLLLKTFPDSPSYRPAGSRSLGKYPYNGNKTEACVGDGAGSVLSGEGVRDRL